jgi:hypothetical protein
VRRIGSGHPALHRFRVGLEFALSGHREVDGMIAHHAAIARSLGEQLGLPDDVLDALGGAPEQWDGHGWPGELKGEAVPRPARIAQLAEFTEVAFRVGGVQAARELAQKRRGSSRRSVAAASSIGRLPTCWRARRRRSWLASPRSRRGTL